jgi:hypothetical protein
MLAARTRIIAAISLAVMFAAVSLPGDFDLDWYTIDGGGEMWSAGGDYELSGTIGQPDASLVMTGGDFELTGGFWKPAERIPDKPDVTPEPPELLEEEYEESAAEPLPPP